MLSGLGRRLARPTPEASDTAFGTGLDLPESMTGAGWATEVGRTYRFTRP
jgi:hypothetical protein